MAEVCIAKTFTKSSTALGAADRARVFDFMTKFLENPAHPGLSVERIHHASSSDVWSARITGGLRAIYYKQGDRLTLLYAGQHDDAYYWAERRSVENHPVTGTLQIVETTEEAEKLLKSPEASALDAGLFEQHQDEYLLSLGLPESWLPVIRQVKDEDQLLTIIDKLPEEVAERLLDLADGRIVVPPVPVSPQEPISASPDNMRRFWVVQDAAELGDILNKPLEDWLRFLHPSQQDLAKSQFSGPVKVTGSAGTGKTVVAMHRAAHLAAQGKRVLLTTFLTTLRENIEYNMDLLCSGEQRKRITVNNVHNEARRLADAAGFRANPTDDETIDALISRFQDRCGAMFGKDFLLAEWNGVIDAGGILTWDEYRDAKRTGRGRGLQVRQRKQIWNVFQRVLESLEDQRLAIWSMFSRRALDALQQGIIESPFDAVVIDEVQDLKPQELRLLATLAASHPEDLMVVGDAGQRIYPGGFSLKSLGIDVRGRSHILQINYRTTEQIRRFADDILPESADDLDGGTESRKGTRSLLHGPSPTVQGFKKAADQVVYVAEQIEKQIAAGLRPEEIAVFARAKNRYKPLVDALKEKNIPVHILTREGNQESDSGINFGTTHRAKGLEFKVVFAYDCSEGIMPHEHILAKYRDPADYEAARLREKQLLYVSITRARDEAYITWAGRPSPFLPSQD